MPEPKPTLVLFPLTQKSQDLFNFYVVGMGFPKPTWGLHCTSVYSRAPINYTPVMLPEAAYQGSCNDLMLLKGKLGLCLVLGISCQAVHMSHTSALGLGASWDYPQFHPHITIAYDVDIEELLERPLHIPHFTLTFEKESVKTLDENWKPK